MERLSGRVKNFIHQGIQQLVIFYKILVAHFANYWKELLLIYVLLYQLLLPYFQLDLCITHAANNIRCSPPLPLHHPHHQPGTR